LLMQYTQSKTKSLQLMIQLQKRQQMGGLPNCGKYATVRFVHVFFTETAGGLAKLVSLQK